VQNLSNMCIFLEGSKGGFIIFSEIINFILVTKKGD